MSGLNALQRGVQIGRQRKEKAEEKMLRDQQRAEDIEFRRREADARKRLEIARMDPDKRLRYLIGEAEMNPNADQNMLAQMKSDLQLMEEEKRLSDVANRMAKERYAQGGAAKEGSVTLGKEGEITRETMPMSAYKGRQEAVKGVMDKTRKASNILGNMKNMKTSQDREALQWAADNPSDPRSGEILRKLRVID